VLAIITTKTHYAECQTISRLSYSHYTDTVGHKCKGRYYFGCTASFIALQFRVIPPALLNAKVQTEQNRTKGEEEVKKKDEHRNKKKIQRQT
jgi:hypothetical protein